MVGGKFVAYYRVSTDKQRKSGLGLAAQRKVVAGYLVGANGQLLDEFTEIESGTRNPSLRARKGAGGLRRARGEAHHR